MKTTFQNNKSGVIKFTSFDFNSRFYHNSIIITQRLENTLRTIKNHLTAPFFLIRDIVSVIIVKILDIPRPKRILFAL